LKYLRHLRFQIPTIAALGRTALGAASQSLRPAPRSATGDLATLAPGPHHYALLPPPDGELIADFITHLGGDAALYDQQVPPHLFPQWTFSLLAKTLEGLPLPTHRLLNGGFRMAVNGPLPTGEALEVEAWLAEITEESRKVRLTQRIVTGTASSPQALTIDFFPVLPRRNKGESAGAKDTSATTHDPRLDPTVPEEGVEHLGSIDLSRRAGLEFALLTGDFNPIHWIGPAARLSGFRDVILHGFASFGHAFERFVSSRLDGDISRVQAVTARFSKPLTLPAKAEVFANDAGSLWLAKARGAKSWMSAHIEHR